MITINKKLVERKCAGKKINVKKCVKSNYGKRWKIKEWNQMILGKTPINYFSKKVFFTLWKSVFKLGSAFNYFKSIFLPYFLLVKKYEGENLIIYNIYIYLSHSQTYVIV